MNDNRKAYPGTGIFGRTINRFAAEIWDLYHDQATAEFFRSMWNGVDERIIIDALRLYWRDIDHKYPPAIRDIMKIVYELKLEGYPDVRK